jgi:hypothetical protein
MTDGSSRTADTTRQLRLALSMNGGVSLAVWIGGAVSEIDCLRRGDGFWGDLLEGCGFQREASVDVMTGASAGGLNAVLMAQAIRSGTPFSKFLTLWQDHADIDRLLKGPLHAAKDGKRAVLKGEYFQQSLRDALNEPAQVVPLTQNLAVFASATLVRPNPVEFRDVPGAPIAETRSDAYFHIARRGSSARGLDAFEPSDLVIDNIDALALVGRATSSLPGLFEPVRFQRSSFGGRLVGAFTRLRDEVEVMDGGVIDNVPIARAIRAIANSPADGRVRRVLLYLHPDPGGRRGPSAGRDPTTALQVVQSFLGKRKESIREDIELLRSHNDAVERRRDEGDSLLKSFSDPQYSVDDREWALLAQSINAAMLLRAAIDPPSELTWHAPNVPRVVPLVDDPQDPSKAELAADILQVVEDPDVLVAVATRRIVLALQRIISSIGAAAPEVDFDHVQPELYELSLLCDVITSYQLARFLGHGSGSAATTRLSLSRRELDDILVGDELDDQTWHALASWDLSGATSVPTGHRLGVHLASLVTNLIDHMPKPPKELGLPAADVLRKLKSGAVKPEALDQALLPLAAESVASDQPIEFVRVAGDVSTPASEAFNLYAKNGQPKIAGLQLHHLGAFFDRDWRTNDWWWGRLDSVRALLDVVLDDEAVQAMRNSGYLTAHGFDDADRTVDDIKHWLLERRQLELLNERCGKQPNFEAAIHSDEFIAWARSDRRLSSLLGTRTLTSTAIRGVITSSKILRVGLSRAAQVALTVIRPVLLATAGIALAGRRAAAAVVWTVCVMVASRSHNHNDRWALWVVGLALGVGIAVLVEVKIRPAYKSPLQLWPYAYAAAGVVAGAVACAKYDWLQGTNETPVHPSSWVWIIPAVAAAASAAMLFFWMRGWAAALLTALTALLYLHFAHAAFRAQIGHPLDDWPRWWMFHSLLVCWVIAILVIPLLLGFMTDNMLRPHPAGPDTGGQTSG